jgi:hypothetical protein
MVRETGELVMVKQPLPLPEGVSDYAVGNYRGRAPASLSYRLMKALPAKEEAYDRPHEERKELSRIYIAGGKFPSGITMEEVENALSPLKNELKKVFKKWGSRKLVVILDIEEGKVRSIQLKESPRKPNKKEVLEKILQKTIFPSSIKGKMELELIYS